jgi:hypothetical protein
VEVALLLGSDSAAVHVYSEHAGHTCLSRLTDNFQPTTTTTTTSLPSNTTIGHGGVTAGPTIPDYPGTFLGKPSGVYLNNTGVFICGGLLDQVPCEGQSCWGRAGCNRLHPATHEVDGDLVVQHTWQQIKYVNSSKGENLYNAYGNAVVAKKISHYQYPGQYPGLWITGGYNPEQDGGHDAVTSTFVWDETMDKLLNYNVKEPYGRRDHCLVELMSHKSPQYQYVEIGGTYNHTATKQRIESYDCLDEACTERQWHTYVLDNVVGNDYDWSKPSCTTYTPPDVNDEVVLIVSGGFTFFLSCEAWHIANFSCTWTATPQGGIFNGDGLIANTDMASMVSLDHVPHLFGVECRFDAGGPMSFIEVYRYTGGGWEETTVMTQGRRTDLVAVSVPADYICYGHHDHDPVMPTTTQPGYNVTKAATQPPLLPRPLRPDRL